MPAPDFIIPGAQKAGTTTIAKCLIKHTSVHIPYIIRGSHELHYFNSNYNLGKRWYETRFDFGKVNGDKSPDYLLEQKYISRIAKDYPNVKIIFCVRNPVDRLLSQVNMRRSIGKTGLTLNRILNSPEYFGRGLYGKIYKMLTSYFPSKNIFICINDKPDMSRYKKKDIREESGICVYNHSEEFKSKMARIFTFLGLEPPECEYESHFVAPKYYPLESVANQIELFKKKYTPDIESFFEQIGYEIKGWL